MRVGRCDPFRNAFHPNGQPRHSCLHFRLTLPVIGTAQGIVRADAVFFTQCIFQCVECGQLLRKHVGVPAQKFGIGLELGRDDGVGFGGIARRGQILLQKSPAFLGIGDQLFQRRGDHVEFLFVNRAGLHKPCFILVILPCKPPSRSHGNRQDQADGDECPDGQVNESLVIRQLQGDGARLGLSLGSIRWVHVHRYLKTLHPSRRFIPFRISAEIHFSEHKYWVISFPEYPSECYT